MMSLTSQLKLACPLASDVISSPDVVTDALTENLLTFVISFIHTEIKQSDTKNLRR